VSNSINLTRRLDWADTDAAGYWHHSTFWKYAEAGEAELVRAAGLTDIVFGHSPRRSVAAEFIRPIYFDDEVTIDCTVEHLGRTSLTYAITLSVGDEIAATGTMSVVLVDVDGRPTPWPDEVRRALG
jgi:acyl-CoA thioester hydrolase